jgi:hypothetical protein
MREFLAPRWVVRAISNAKWGGVKVRDVLKECGLDFDSMVLKELEIPGLEHIQLEAYDHDETGVHHRGYVNHRRFCFQRDGTLIEFGGNTPTGGKFAEPWVMHGWTADAEHGSPSGLKVKPKTFYTEEHDRKARIQKEVEKCDPKQKD